jgi:hypothetical protein
LTVMTFRVLIFTAAILAGRMVSDATTAELAIQPPAAAIAAPKTATAPPAFEHTHGKLSEGGIQANDGL